ncbi:uncharacterized protein EDB93DRAFT_1111090 [Suillus bovinus]|uniref:uncharacterized protein n=1 Tax=Suillus bovinus TaxID=48563 RepID=UPI001B867713|nr:uncharacterized protein EDB93DRAFT_1111090 [Suillus bovinus]KAG2159598.1 hypothetical protein EDB93DRAFT_1111090 [Suillus bovinus]
MAKQIYCQAGSRLNHQRRHSPAAIACPSSSVLSILATIAASSQTVDGSPLPAPTPPPSFLCPSLDLFNTCVRNTTPTTSYSSTTSSTSPTPIAKFTQPVADKYVLQSDGRWHKATAWTLYGSTYHASSPDLTVDVSRSTSVLNPTASAEMDSVLPAGWSTTSQSNRTASIIILSLAIILAVSICMFIISCIVWRKRRKKILDKDKTKNDLELKARHKVNPEDLSEDGEREIEARGKNRLWARASERWKANIRNSARRRRRRHGMSTRSRPQSPTLLDPREPSVHPSPVSSRRHSIVSVSEDTDYYAAPIENRLDPTQPPFISADPSSPCTVSSPPAYMFPALPVRPEIEGCPHEASHVSSDDPTLRRGSLLFGHDCSSTDHDDIPYHPSGAGHVAIDDKAHLARMAELASAPPVIQDNTSGSPSHIHESAPEWHDDFDDQPSQLVIVSSSLSEVGNLGFPNPPSKNVLSPGYFDGHSYVQDITALDPISLPSMPPYEARPNAIPFEDTLTASAPPILEHDETFGLWEGSAPEVSEIYGDDCDTHVAPSPSQPSSSAFSSQASAPPEELVTMHGILPIYQR